MRYQVTNQTKYLGTCDVAQATAKHGSLAMGDAHLFASVTCQDWHHMILFIPWKPHLERFGGNSFRLENVRADGSENLLLALLDLPTMNVGTDPKRS